MTVSLRLVGSVVDECLLFVIVVVFAIEQVEIMRLPVTLGGLGSENLVVSEDLLIVVLQVLIADDVVVLETLVLVVDHFDLDLSQNRVTYLLWFGLWPLFRRIKVVILQVHVADNVIVRAGVPLRSEVPWLLFRIVWPILQTGQLVLEVQHIVSLFIPQRAIFILCEGVDELLLLVLPGNLLTALVSIDLGDRVVTSLALLN